MGWVTCQVFAQCLHKNLNYNDDDDECDDHDDDECDDDDDNSEVNEWSICIVSRPVAPPAPNFCPTATILKLKHCVTVCNLLHCRYTVLFGLD